MLRSLILFEKLKLIIFVGSEPVAVVTEAYSCDWFCLIVELGSVSFLVIYIYFNFLQSLTIKNGIY